MVATRAFQTLYPGYFQTSYVTNNIDRAMEQLGDVYNIASWYTNWNFEYSVRPGKTVTIRLALAYVGDTQIEIIEPIAGEFAFYKAVLRDGDDFQVTFHHCCQAFDTVEQYDMKVADLKLSGIDMPVDITREMKNGFSLACYADLRRQCGHFIEYVWFNDVGLAWMGTVPRN